MFLDGKFDGQTSPFLNSAVSNIQIGESVQPIVTQMPNSVPPDLSGYMTEGEGKAALGEGIGEFLTGIGSLIAELRKKKKKKGEDEDSAGELGDEDVGVGTTSEPSYIGGAVTTPAAGPVSVMNTIPTNGLRAIRPQKSLYA